MNRKDFLLKFAVLAVCMIVFQVAVFLFHPSSVYAGKPVPPPTPTPTPPNIILINTDDMGWGDLCKNVEGSTVKPAWCGTTTSGTPKLDTLANQGVRLSNFYTPTPLCTPSRAALMTGRDPRRVNVTYAVTSTSNYLPVTEKTLAQVLKSIGYNTAIVGKWNLGWDTATSNTGKDSWDRGFDYNHVLPIGVHWPFGGFCLAEKNLSSAVTWTYLEHQLGGSDERGDICPGATGYPFWTFTQNKSLTEHLSNKAITYINTLEAQGKPFFLYLAHLAPHTPMDIHLPNNIADPYILKTDALSICEKAPYNCPKNDLLCVAQCQITEVYDEVIKEIDLKGVGPILTRICSPDRKAVCKSPLYQNTIILFTSDNGPYRGDAAELPSLGNTGGMRGSKKFTYEGGVRVPFIAQWPGKWDGGGNHTLEHLADMKDIFPTLVKVALKGAGMCSDNNNCVCSDNNNCVQNGAYANDTARVRFTGKDAVFYDIAVDGKDISDMLDTGASNTDQKNIQISWFGNYAICVSWDGNGICNGYQDSHPFAIRSNVTLNAPADIANYKLYFLGDDPIPTDPSSNVNKPVELYNLSTNLSESESVDGLCYTGSSNLCCVGAVNYCSQCTIDNATNVATCPSQLGTYKSIVETLWKRANLYQNNVKNNQCQGAANYTDSCPQSCASCVIQ